MEIRERIITEAGQLFVKYGVRSITMDTLAENMGISKRTIYENFKDKDEMLVEIIQYFKEFQLKEANEIFENSENVVVALFKLLNNMVNTMKQVNPLFFHDMKKYHSEIFRKFHDQGDIRDHSITKRMLKEGMEQGIFRQELNMEIVNLTIHELFNMFSPESDMTSSGFHRGDLFNNIIIPYLLGISTEFGRSLIEKHEPVNY